MRVHRACAACFAISLRLSALRLAARAAPPIFPARRTNSVAGESAISSCCRSSISPVAISTISFPSWIPQTEPRANPIHSRLPWPLGRAARNPRLSESLPNAAGTLSRGAETSELALHRVDLVEICRDIVVAAAFAGDQMEATARRRWRGCTAEMDHRGERLLLLLVGRRVWPARKNRRDVAV
jgi:hypothetical protein